MKTEVFFVCVKLAELIALHHYPIKHVKVKTNSVFLKYFPHKTYLQCSCFEGRIVELVSTRSSVVKSVVLLFQNTGKLLKTRRFAYRISTNSMLLRQKQQTWENCTAFSLSFIYFHSANTFPITAK